MSRGRRGEPSGCVALDLGHLGRVSGRAARVAPVGIAGKCEGGNEDFDKKIDGVLELYGAEHQANGDKTAKRRCDKLLGRMAGKSQSSQVGGDIGWSSSAVC